MAMVDVSLRGGSWEVIRPTTIAWFKMENDCIFYNIIEALEQKKTTKTERGRPLGPFRLQISLAYFVNTQILQLIEGRIDQWGVGYGNLFFGLESH